MFVKRWFASNILQIHMKFTYKNPLEFRGFYYIFFTEYYARRRRENIRPKEMKNAAAIRRSDSGPVCVFVMFEFGLIGVVGFVVVVVPAGFTVVPVVVTPVDVDPATFPSSLYATHS